MGRDLQTEASMTVCAVCGCDAVKPGLAVMTLQRDAATLVFRDVPAMICAECGEQYTDEETTSKLLNAAERATVNGLEVSVLRYVA
jgi:YgiT-type zinc finger domain-containing protein